MGYRRQLKFGLGVAIAMVMMGTTACTDNPPPQDIPASEPPNLTESATTDQEAITLGVLAIDSALSVNERYSPLVAYLEDTLNQDFDLVPLSQQEQFEQAAAQDIDFIASNPLSSVQLQRLYNTEMLVTYSRPQTQTQFSGLIIVAADSEINSLEGLRNKTGACVNFQTAAAGCTFQIRHLLEQGINFQTDFASFTEQPSQDNIVLGVLNGTLDFGFIRTGQLEKMTRKGLIANPSVVKILDPMADDFFYAHTTALYPEWPIAALPHVNPDLKEAVQTALLTVPSDHPALKSVGVEQFVPAIEYTILDDLIETLQLKTWDVAPTSDP